MATPTEKKRHCPPLGASAVLVAYGLTHMFYDSSEYYERVRGVMADNLDEAGISGIDLPGTKGEFRKVRSSTLRKVADRIARISALRAFSLAVTKSGGIRLTRLLRDLRSAAVTASADGSSGQLIGGQRGRWQPEGSGSTDHVCN